MSAASVLMTRISAGTSGSYPSLVVTDSFEKAMAAEQENMACVLVTTRPSQIETIAGEVETIHSLLVEISPGVKPSTQSTTVAVQTATNALVEAVLAAVNGRTGYEYFRGQGYLMAEMSSMSEDSRSPDMVNPHIFTCHSYASD